MATACELVFFGGPESGRTVRWHGAPPFLWRFPVPLGAPSLFPVAEEVVSPGLVAVYERRSARPNNSFAYAYLGTRTD
jgi:hypothetical protein